MDNKKYYTLDINKNKPEILISNTNRSAGKTTFYTNYMKKDSLRKKKCLAL